MLPKQDIPRKHGKENVYPMLSFMEREGDFERFLASGLFLQQEGRGMSENWC